LCQSMVCCASTARTSTSCHPCVSPCPPPFPRPPPSQDPPRHRPPPRNFPRLCPTPDPSRPLPRSTGCCQGLQPPNGWENCPPSVRLSVQSCSSQSPLDQPKPGSRGSTQCTGETATGGKVSYRKSEESRTTQGLFQEHLPTFAGCWENAAAGLQCVPWCASWSRTAWLSYTRRALSSTLPSAVSYKSCQE